MEKEELIKHYSYYYCDSEDFVKEYLENYEEMDQILKTVFKNIKNIEKDYIIRLFENGIGFENKKTKKCYNMKIEF